MIQGKPEYLIIAGILLLDLLLIIAGSSWLLISCAIAITFPLLLITFQLNSARNNPTLSQSSELSVDIADQEDPAINTEIKTATPHLEEDQTSEINEIPLLVISSAQPGKNDITSHLKNWGVNYTIVQSSARAFATLVQSSLSEKPYQTVLVDQRNLDMDDCQFAIALRAEPLLQPLYLIHYGGSVISTRAEQLETAGYSKILHSPIDKTLLYSALHSAVEIQTHHNIIQLLDHYESDKKQPPLEVLIASHNSSECNKLRRILSAAGHQTFILTEGSQVLDALDNHHFDLAILDANMPDVSGIEVIKLYRFTRLNQPWVPFILVLDNPNSQTIQACENADIHNLIVKPINTQRLHSTIEDALQREQEKNDAFGYHASNIGTPHPNDDLTLDTHQLEELKRLGKEKGFLLELINQFDKESSNLIDGLRNSVLSNDIKSAKEYGHKLKDTAGNLGALNLYRLAVRTTRINTSSSAVELDSLVAEMANCRTSTIQALLDHLSKGNNSAYAKE